MFRSSIMLLATMLCVSCVSHRPIQDSSSPPIDAANPLDGTPVALAWSSGTQLMMGVDTGAVQTSHACAAGAPCARPTCPFP